MIDIHSSFTCTFDSFWADDTDYNSFSPRQCQDMPDGLMGFKDSHNDQRDHQACILLLD